MGRTARKDRKAKDQKQQLAAGPAEALGSVDENLSVIPSNEDEASESASELLELEPLGNVALISSVLFAAVRPMSVASLSDVIDQSEEEVLQALAEIKTLFVGGIHGFSLQEVAGGYQFRTDPAAGPALKRLYPPRHRRLSRAALETLAIIAYKQPVQRAEIEAVRGVDALPTLKTLLDSRLIQIVGRQDAPGQPALYGTTGGFLEKFGIQDLSHLPSLRELEQLTVEPGEGETGEGEPVDSDVMEDVMALEGLEIEKAEERAEFEETAELERSEIEATESEAVEFSGSEIKAAVGASK